MLGGTKGPKAAVGGGWIYDDHRDSGGRMKGTGMKERKRDE